MAQNRNLFRLTRFILLRLPYLFRFLAWFRKPGRQGRLLIIKPDAIGDFILFRNFLEQIKCSAKYKDYKIDLLGNKMWEDMALAYDTSFVSKFIFIEVLKLYYKPIEVYKLGLQLYKKNYALVLNPSTTRILITDGLAALCAAKQTIGFKSDNEGIEEKYRVKTQKFYTTKINLPPAIYHEFYRNKFFFEQVLGESLVIEKPSIPIRLKTREGIVIFPGAGIKKRSWEAEKFVLLIKLIQQQTTQTIYIAGSSNELAVSDFICKASSGNVVNIAGQNSLLQVIDKVASSLLIIGNDSGAVHMAVAVDTPSVCLVGGGHFDRFIPYPKGIVSAPVCVYQKMECYYCNWNCIYQTNVGECYPCISNITVKAAWNALRPLLGSV